MDCAKKAEIYLEKSVADLTKPPVINVTFQGIILFIFYFRYLLLFELHISFYLNILICFPIKLDTISTQGAQSLLEQLIHSLREYLANRSEETLSVIIPIVFPFAQSIGLSILQGQQLAHSLPDLEKVDQMLDKCATVGKVFMLLFQLIQKEFNSNEVDISSDQVWKYLIKDLFFASFCFNIIMMIIFFFSLGYCSSTGT